LGSAAVSKVAVYSLLGPAASIRALSEQDSPAVNTLTMESILDSASEHKISNETEPTGCGSSISRKSSSPRVKDSVFASTRNSSVTRVAGGRTPTFCRNRKRESPPPPQRHHHESTHN